MSGPQLIGFATEGLPGAYRGAWPGFGGEVLVETA